MLSFSLAHCHIYSTTQPFSEADYLCQTLQFNFDRILCDVLEKYYYFSGFTLLVGSLLWYTKADQTHANYYRIVASFFVVRQEGHGHILDEIGFSGYLGIDGFTADIWGFFTYFTELLENPE